MNEGWPVLRDRPLVAMLRGSTVDVAIDAASLFERAERHGLSGVVHDAWVAAGAPLPPALAQMLDTRRLVRDLDHEAHLALLRRIDDALAAAGIRGTLLKGAALAERLYPRPSARATSDVDLLVDEPLLDRAATALASAGYVASTDPREEWSRREHHHLHLEHPAALPLELHFHAYRGFGRILRSTELLDRSAPFRDMRALRVLAPEDEVVYLAVHAAAHRFIRLGWLYDLKLLVATMTDDSLAQARERAGALEFARVVAFTGELLSSVLGVERGALLGRIGRVRSAAARRLFAEPSDALLRSASRFAFTVTLCDSPRAASVYALRAARDRLGAQRA